MPVTLYHAPMSPVCQSVLLVIKALELEDIQLKEIDFSRGEHMSEAFLKRNPRHTVPLLCDGDLNIWESHAIIPYLVDKYGKKDDLYPRDLALRAQVNQLLHFDNAVLYTRLRDMSEQLWYKKLKTISEESSKHAEEGYQALNDLIGDGPWLLGDRLTIADICCMVNVKSIEVFIGDTSYYPKLTKWLKHCAENIIGYDEIVLAGTKTYKEVIRGMMNAP